MTQEILEDIKSDLLNLKMEYSKSHFLTQNTKVIKGFADLITKLNHNIDTSAKGNCPRCKKGKITQMTSRNSCNKCEYFKMN